MNLAPANHLPAPASLAAVLMSVALLAGCSTLSTTSTPPAFDTSGPQWQIVTTQAVWTPARRKTPIAGDVVVARHPDGQVLVEMSKASLPIATLRLTTNAWHFEASGRPHPYGGNGPPPARSAWLVFAQELAGGPRPPLWTFSIPAPGLLRIENPASGETLDVQEPDGRRFGRQP